MSRCSRNAADVSRLMKRCISWCGSRERSTTRIAEGSCTAISSPQTSSSRRRKMIRGRSGCSTSGSRSKCTPGRRRPFVARWAHRYLFMAVEQVERPSEATPLSDVYALAVMVYLMVTGRYPWGEHHSAFELYRRQQSERPDPAPTMPPGWEDPVFSALSPDPQQRPRSMHEFVYPLAVALAPYPPYGSGLEILRGVSRRWASSSPDDETLRGTATTGAWRAAISGAWIAASGSWPAATSGAWPAGSWPGATSGSWPVAASAEPAIAASATPSTAASERRMPAAWKLALLAMAAAVLAGVVVFVMVMAVRALEGR